MSTTWKELLRNVRVCSMGVKQSSGSDGQTQRLRLRDQSHWHMAAAEEMFSSQVRIQQVRGRAGSHRPAAQRIVIRLACSAAGVCNGGDGCGCGVRCGMHSVWCAAAGLSEAATAAAAADAAAAAANAAALRHVLDAAADCNDMEKSSCLLTTDVFHGLQSRISSRFGRPFLTPVQQKRAHLAGAALPRLRA